MMTALAMRLTLACLRPASVPAAFKLDPEIKQTVWAGPLLRPAATLAQRDGHLLKLRDANGGRGWNVVERPIPRWASMLTEFVDPQSAPEMLALREQVRSWRFYDHFRSDVDAPARQPQLGTYARAQQRRRRCGRSLDDD